MKLEEILARLYTPVGYVTVPTGCNTTEALAAISGPHVLCVVPKALHGVLRLPPERLVSPQWLLRNLSVLDGFGTVLVMHRKDPIFGERTVHAVWRRK